MKRCTVKHLNFTR